MCTMSNIEGGRHTGNPREPGPEHICGMHAETGEYIYVHICGYVYMVCGLCVYGGWQVYSRGIMRI